MLIVKTVFTRREGIVIYQIKMPTSLYIGENIFYQTIYELLTSLKAKRVLYFTGSRGKKVIPNYNGRENFTEKVFVVEKEPTVHMVENAKEVSEEFQPDAILSIGGGSVIDLAKTISFLTNDENNLIYYFDHPSTVKVTIPHIAIPTTCGTGAEVTANAVIRRETFKQSIRSDSLRPYATIIDPLFTKNLPLDVLIFSSLDSLTQLIEAFVSNKANPITEGICREGLRLFQKGFQYERLSSLKTEERLYLQIAALYSGIALSNSRLGIVHGVASVLGERTPMAHGEICARFLLPFTKANIYKALQENEQILSKYQEIACILGDDHNLTYEDLPEILKRYEGKINNIRLPPISISKIEWEVIAEETLFASSTQGTPFTYTKNEVLEVLLSVN